MGCGHYACLSCVERLLNDMSRRNIDMFKCHGHENRFPVPLVARVGDCLPALVSPVTVGELRDDITGMPGELRRRKTIGELSPLELKDKIKSKIRIET